MALRRPSPKTINLYNRLVENQNKVRKQLRRIHKNAEEASGAGRLPTLVIPKSAHKIRHNYFEGLSSAELQRRLKQFYEKLNNAKALFASGIKSYLSRTLKDGYMELWRDQILFRSGESPEGYFGKFSTEQIENSYMGEFMEVYNMMMSLSAETFLALLYSGKIIQFKFIYSDMNTGLEKEPDSWLMQQKELLEIYRSPKARMQLFEGMKDIIPSLASNNQREFKRQNDEEIAKSYTGVHRNKSVSKAEKMKERADERSR